MSACALPRSGRSGRVRGVSRSGDPSVHDVSRSDRRRPGRRLDRQPVRTARSRRGVGSGDHDPGRNADACSMQAQISDGRAACLLQPTGGVRASVLSRGAGLGTSLGRVPVDLRLVRRALGSSHRAHSLSATLRSYHRGTRAASRYDFPRAEAAPDARSHAASSVASLRSAASRGVRPSWPIQSRSAPCSSSISAVARWPP